MLGLTILFLCVLKCPVLLLQHFVVLFKSALVHYLQQILVLFVLVLKICHAGLICLREHVDFFLVSAMQFLLHLLEGLDIEL